MINQSEKGGAARVRNARESYAAPALEKAFDILEVLAGKPLGLALTDIAAELRRSLGELYRIAIVMERRGYIRRDAAGERYLVAYKLLDLAYRATPAQHLMQAALPIMRDLANRIEQSCHLVVLSEGKGLVIARQESPRGQGFSVKMGTTVDLVDSCSGQILLAFSGQELFVQLIEAYRRATAKAVDLPALERSLEAIRARECLELDSPMTHGVTDLSFPVRGFDGKLVAALTVPFLELIDGSQRIAIADARSELGKAAMTIAAELGWNDGSPLMAA